MDVVEIPVGYDPFHAQMIKDYCADQGIEGEVVIFDATRYQLGTAARVQNLFVCSGEDAPIVRTAIADLLPQLVDGYDQARSPIATAMPSWGKRFVAALLGFIFVGPLVYFVGREFAGLLGF